MGKTGIHLDAYSILYCVLNYLGEIRCNISSRRRTVEMLYAIRRFKLTRW